MKALQTSRRSSEDSLASSEGTPTVRIHLEHLLGGEAASDREPQAAARRPPQLDPDPTAAAAKAAAEGSGRFGEAGGGGRNLTASEDSDPNQPSGRSSEISNQSYVSSVSLEEIVREVERTLSSRETEPPDGGAARSGGARARYEGAAPEAPATLPPGNLGAEDGEVLIGVPWALPKLSESKCIRPPSPIPRFNSMFEASGAGARPPAALEAEPRRRSDFSPGRAPAPPMDSAGGGRFNFSAVASTPPSNPAVQAGTRLERRHSSKKRGAGPSHVGAQLAESQSLGKVGSAEKSAAHHRRNKSSDSLFKSPSDSLAAPAPRRTHKRSLSGMDGANAMKQKQKRHSAGAAVQSTRVSLERVMSGSLLVDVGEGSPQNSGACPPPQRSPVPVQTRVSILNLDDERPSIISTTNISIEDLVHESAGGGALEPDVVAAPRDDGRFGAGGGGARGGRRKGRRAAVVAQGLVRVRSDAVRPASVHH